MRVVQGWRSDPERSLTDPLPEKRWSVIIRFLGGDWLDPIGAGTNWFEPPFPKRILHVWWPLWASYVLFAVATSAFIAALIYWPLWSWPVTFLLWLLTPGKQIAWRFDKHAGYAGFKPYGVDSPVYGQWLCYPVEVYDGSQALCWTIRLWATMKD